MKKIKQTIRNNLYMVKMLATFSPRYIIFSLFVGLFRVYDIAVSIYLIRYLIGAIMNHDKSTTSVVLWLVILCAIKVILTGVESYYNNIFLPKNQITFRKKFHT